MSKLIALEGIDGCGKTTQTKLVADRLLSMGISVKTFAFPSQISCVSGLLNSILRGETKVDKITLQLLFEADRAELQPQLRKWLEEYDVVLLDRYTASGLVYGMANGLPMTWCTFLQDRFIRSYDILLEVDPNVVASRWTRTHVSIYDRDLHFQRRLAMLYCDLIPFERRVDASRSIEEVTESIVSLILKVIKRG